MLLKRLFQPKWRRPEAGSGDARTASQAADPGARRQTCKSLTDLEELRRIAIDDTDAGVREFATARLRKLMCGGEAGSPDTATAIGQLQAMADATLAGHLAREAADPELRRAALALCPDPDVHCNAALHDPVAAVRLAAARLIDDKPTLERLARQIGRKDKNVIREVRGKLKAIGDREQEPLRRREQAEELCRRIERLGRLGNWQQDLGVLELSEKDWGGIEADLPDSLRQRYQRARESFLANYDQHRHQEQAREREQQRHQALLARKQALVAELDALDPQQVDGAALDDLKARWNALDALPGAAEQDQQQAWQRAWRRAGDLVSEQQRQQEREQRLQALCKNGRDWAGQSAPLPAKELKRWMEQGDKLVAAIPADTTGGDFETLRQSLGERLEKQHTHAVQKLAGIDERLDRLEQELDQGSLKPATALQQSIRSDLELGRASDLPRRELERADQRLHRLTPRLRELQNWRKWGTDQHRQELLQAMQELQNADLAAQALFEQVQSLQQQWKSLDHSGSPVNEGLWKRFHDAADSVFERCKPFLEQQAEQRELNRQAREALCRKLEDFLAQVDWDNVDWKKTARAEREIRAEWADLGEVAPKQRKALDKRYHAAMKQLDRHLSDERNANKRLKQGLIEQAHALVDEPDLDRAIEGIKDLQKQWHTTVPLRRKQENQLWQQFRACCDQVFGRRDESRNARRRELEENAGVLAGLCAELEAAVSAGADDPKHLEQQLHQLQGRWNEAQRADLERKEAERLKRRWQAGVAALQQHAAHLRQAAERARMQHLAQAAGLCAELEAAVENGAADPWQVEKLQQRWEARQAQLLPDGLQQRFHAALQALQDEQRRRDWVAGLERNAGQRAEICLQLEVLAGVDSPAEAAQERLALQVNRLAERLAEGEADPLTALPRLEQAWYQCGPAPAAQAAALENRFQRALQAALQQSSSTQAEERP